MQSIAITISNRTSILNMAFNPSYGLWLAQKFRSLALKTIDLSLWLWGLGSEATWKAHAQKFRRASLNIGLLWGTFCFNLGLLKRIAA